jgi:hypothetical protein
VIKFGEHFVQKAGGGASVAQPGETLRLNPNTGDLEVGHQMTMNPSTGQYVEVPNGSRLILNPSTGQHEVGAKLWMNPMSGQFEVK